MTSRSELKAQAKEALKGKWIFAVAIILITFGISLVLNMVPLIGNLASLIIAPAISFIPLQLFLKVTRNEEARIEDFFSNFTYLGKYWGLFARLLLKFIPVIVLIIVLVLIPFITIAIGNSAFSIIGTILTIGIYIYTIFLGYKITLEYSQAIYVFTDEPEMGTKYALEKSKELMEGHKIELLILQLSFIGWVLLTGLTLGILILYVQPYMSTTLAAYYDALKGNTTEKNNDEPITTF